MGVSENAMPQNDAATYEVLAETGDISVYRCDQGCLHLQVGNLNLRLEDSEFEELVAVISAASLRTGPVRVMPAPRFGRVQ